MTFTGTDNFGNTVARTGTVTILPNGTLTYNWTDTVTDDGVIKATGSGTTTQTPGTYFSQTATGQATPAPTWREPDHRHQLWRFDRHPRRKWYNHQLQSRLLGDRYRSQRRHLHVFRTPHVTISFRGGVGGAGCHGVRSGS